MLPSGTKYGSTEVLPEIDTSVQLQRVHVLPYKISFIYNNVYVVIFRKYESTWLRTTFFVHSYLASV